MDYEKLDELREKLNSFRPLPEEVLKNLHEDLVLRWTYNSNAIEGNTLTVQETKVALEGITVGGKTMTEHLEAINHREAILYMEDIVKKKEILSEFIIKSIHSLILKNIDDKNAGVYRNSNVIISGAKHRPPEYIHVSIKMENFIKWYVKESKNLHPIERATRVHIDFVGIHPFVDGNGRTARLLMNLELMKSGFPPAIIKVEDRLVYYKALDDAHIKKDYKGFLNLMCKVVEESFEPYFYILGINE